MTHPVSVEIDQGVAKLTICNPPVNALSYVVRQGLLSALNDAEANDAVAAIVITSNGRMFSAGADIREFDAAVIEPGLPGLIDHVEACSKPVVVALYGTVLGGGCELALGCHFRVASPDIKIGLPEVDIGLIPGAGGTQRLPRLVGVESAIDMITSGRHVPGDEALAFGLIDEIAEIDLVAAAVQAARRLSSHPDLVRRTGTLSIDQASVSEDVFDAAKKRLKKQKKGFDAPIAAIDAIRWSMTFDFEEGLAKERECSKTLKASTQSKAQRHLFFAQRAALKIPDIPKETPLRNIQAAGVIGAGTMGAGIAVCLLRAGLPVILVETQQDALDAGIARIQKVFDREVQKGRLSEQKRKTILSQLTGALELAALEMCDVVIEAVFESMDLKKQIFTQLGQVTKAEAILASNTSTLDVNVIADATQGPERVIGTHFFSPAHIMRLLEVVRGNKTAKDVVATTMDLGRKIGKVPALSGVGFGFIGNRMLEDYVRESQLLLLEGATPAQIDGVLEDWGMAMGPCAVMDLAGQDVSFLTRDQNRHHLPDDPRYYKPGDLMNASGRFGQKTGKGFYQYLDGRTRQEDPDAIELIQEAARDLGVKPRQNIRDQEILERCLFSLVNRGAQLLDDGIALRASDIDVVWASGYGFPAYRGGPMFYGDTVGLSVIVEAFKGFASHLGNDYGYWTPAPLLQNMAKAGTTFADHDAGRQGGG